MRKMKRLIVLVAIIGGVCLMIDFFRFPECYSAKWRYQLENDIAMGDEVAIEYYNRVYVANGRTLFND